MNQLEFGETNLQKSINAALIFAILTIPLPPIWNSVSLILLGILSFTNFFIEKKILRPPIHYWLLGVVFMVRILWLIKSPDIKYGWASIETEAPLLAIPLIFLVSVNSIKSRSVIVFSYSIMALSVILFSFYTLTKFIWNSQYSFIEYFYLHFTTAQYFAQKNMLAWSFSHYTFLSVILIYGFHLVAFEKKTKVLKIVSLIYALLLIAFVVLCGSKIGIVLLSFSFILYLISFATKKYRHLIFIVLTITISLLTINYKNDITDFVNKSEPMRVRLFEIASTSIMDQPLFGSGTGSQAMVFDSIRFVNQFDFENKTNKVSKVNHPHNQYLAELMQFGFVGALPLFFFIFMVALFSLRTEDYALLAVSLTFALFMMVESPLNSNKGVFPFVLLISLLTVTNPKISHLEN